MQVPAEGERYFSAASFPIFGVDHAKRRFQCWKNLKLLLHLAESSDFLMIFAVIITYHFFLFLVFYFVVVMPAKKKTRRMESYLLEEKKRQDESSKDREEEMRLRCSRKKNRRSCN